MNKTTFRAFYAGFASFECGSLSVGARNTYERTVSDSRHEVGLRLLGFMPGVGGNTIPFIGKYRLADLFAVFLAARYFSCAPDSVGRISDLVNTALEKRREKKVITVFLAPLVGFIWFTPFVGFVCLWVLSCDANGFCVVREFFMGFGSLVFPTATTRRSVCGVWGRFLLSHDSFNARLGCVRAFVVRAHTLRVSRLVGGVL